jgi:cytoskeleton protein RodZ
MATEAGGVGIGARLRAARERRGLTVLQAAEKLHVDARILEALEAENFGPLGADVYARGHLRRYAELLGESSSQLQDLYASAAPAAPPDLTRIPRGERTPGLTRWQLPALVTVIGLALVGLLWWLLSQPGTGPRPVAEPSRTAVASEQVPVQAASAVEAEAHAGAAPVAAPATAAVAPGDVQLSVKVSDKSWVRVSDASGRRLLNGELPAASTRTVSGAPPLRVVLGNATGVALALNGRPLAVSGFVRPKGDAHILVSAAGTVSATPVASEHGE